MIVRWESSPTGSPAQILIPDPHGADLSDPLSFVGTNQMSAKGDVQLHQSSLHHAGVLRVVPVPIMLA